MLEEQLPTSQERIGLMELEIILDQIQCGLTIDMLILIKNKSIKLDRELREDNRLKGTFQTTKFIFI